ncbi:MAG: diacylglycerol kinase family lipid kinase, partial [Actinobacteria bacterium]|nr:diacylglycerol kinase family lipid kinase [Actinomycetota bacterium]
MRILLVVNSFASSVTARNTVIVHRALSRAHDVQVVETNRRGHATRFAQDAAHRGVDLVISFGVTPPPRRAPANVLIIATADMVRKVT